MNNFTPVNSKTYMKWKNPLNDTKDHRELDISPKSTEEI